eukprot:TRINITY_DN278_c0_g1_i2.p3 TRINITY_DN278_c0_g1~~TRINITY_DN278_c0_g1_i2.p3  ORF type:complete len:158 (+),score=47.07 TRINITY_DN278_c0_g1_i2:2-475(+)
MQQPDGMQQPDEMQQPDGMQQPDEMQHDEMQQPDGMQVQPDGMQQQPDMPGTPSEQGPPGMPEGGLDQANPSTDTLSTNTEPPMPEFGDNTTPTDMNAQPAEAVQPQDTSFQDLAQGSMQEQEEASTTTPDAEDGGISNTVSGYREPPGGSADAPMP